MGEKENFEIFEAVHLRFEIFFLLSLLSSAEWFVTFHFSSCPSNISFIVGLVIKPYHTYPFFLTYQSQEQVSIVPLVGCSTSDTTSPERSPRCAS